MKRIAVVGAIAWALVCGAAGAWILHRQEEADREFREAKAARIRAEVDADQAAAEARRALSMAGMDENIATTGRLDDQVKPDAGFRFVPGARPAMLIRYRTDLPPGRFVNPDAIKTVEFKNDDGSHVLSVDRVDGGWRIERASDPRLVVGHRRVIMQGATPTTSFLVLTPRGESWRTLAEIHEHEYGFIVTVKDAKRVVVEYPDGGTP